MHEKRATAQLTSAPLELLRPGDTVKTAGATPAVQAFLDQLRPDPAYTYALVNAMGYSEYYGANSNADWYGHNPHLDFNGLLHAWDGIGDNLETDRMKGRSWYYGYPCFYNSAVFAHHKNECPQKLGFGDVRFVFANHSMKRIELLLRVHNDEARKKGHSSILERLAAGERCDVSMGARVPFDLCSICTDWNAVQAAWARFDASRHAHPGIAVLEHHRTVKPIRGLAVKPSEYCQCMRSQKRQVLDDGRKVFVYNDFPRFFDISFVFVGADRTARAMWYMAPAFSAQQAPSPTRAAFLDAMLQEWGPRQKVAAMDKEITGGMVAAVLADAKAAPEHGLHNLLRLGTPRDILSSAAALGIVATPDEFQELLAHTMPAPERYELCVGARFDTRCPAVNDSMAVDARCAKPAIVEALRHLAPERSSFAPHLAPRLLRETPKVASYAVHGKRDPLRDKIAAAYNGYRLSVLTKVGELAAAGAPELAADPESGAEELAALLLGAAPLLHLLASHLNTDAAGTLEPMTAMLADQPSFSSLATLGHGLRLCMTARRCSIPAAITALLATTKA